MSTQTEQQLRDLFAADADRAPEAVSLAAGAVRQVHRRRRRQMTWTAGVAAVVVVGGLVSVVGLGRQPQSLTSCVEGYSTATLAGRSFAFDGTVTALGPARTNRAGAALPLAGVTFHVNDWFTGGSGDSVTVDLTAPTKGRSGNSTDEAVSSYGVGTRLLVSGEPRWGGAPLDNAIAWGCGFTRYYEAQTAAAWAAATSDIQRQPSGASRSSEPSSTGPLRRRRVVTPFRDRAAVLVEFAGRFDPDPTEPAQQAIRPLLVT